MVLNLEYFIYVLTTPPFCYFFLILFGFQPLFFIHLFTNWNKVNEVDNLTDNSLNKDIQDEPINEIVLFSDLQIKKFNNLLSRYNDYYKNIKKTISYEIKFGKDLEAGLQMLKQKLSTRNDISKNQKDEVIEEFKYKYRHKVLKTFFLHLSNSYIMQSTPMGNVLMKFNAEDDTFDYYSDGVIPFSYLETVALKYVIDNNCSEIYIDMEDEIEKFKQKNTNQKEKEKEEVKEEIQPSKQVFAKLKGYNQSTSMNAAKSEKKNNNIKIATEEEIKDIVLKDQTNKYSYKGKISNFNFLKQVDPSLNNKKLKLSYKDFKNEQKK